jgi:hypothetical protein
VSGRAPSKREQGSQTIARDIGLGDGSSPRRREYADVYAVPGWTDKQTQIGLHNADGK